MATLSMTQNTRTHKQMSQNHSTKI